MEIRSDSGMLEVRILLTAEGTVLQIKNAKPSLKASEAVEIESKRVVIKASDTGDVNATGDVVFIGNTIHLNPDKT